MSFYKTIKEEFGQRYIRCSCIADESTEKLFCEFITKHKINHVVEIGTFFGTSALAFSLIADKVTTIDIKEWTEAKYLWGALPAVAHKITQIIVSSEKEKADILDNLNFDFAFLDGGHSYSCVRLDFEITKKCGRVLFHDYFTAEDDIPGIDFKIDIAKGKDPILFEGVKRFVDTLPKEEVIIKKPFAYWEKR